MPSDRHGRRSAAGGYLVWGSSHKGSIFSLTSRCKPFIIPPCATRVEHRPHGMQYLMGKTITPGDMIRIPIGIMLAYAGGVVGWKGWNQLQGTPITIFILILSFLVGLLFIAIGLAMAFSWVRPRPRRKRPKTS